MTPSNEETPVPQDSAPARGRGKAKLGSSTETQSLPNSDIEAPQNVVQEAARHTDDFALLNPGRPPALQEHFTDSDTWRILRIQSEFVHSFETMSKVGPPSRFSARRACRRIRPTARPRATWRAVW